MEDLRKLRISENAPAPVLASPRNGANPHHHRPKPSSLTAHLRDDPGLAFLTSQLGKIEAQIRYLEQFKRSVTDAEERCLRELAAASAAKSLVSEEKSDSSAEAPPETDANEKSSSQWVRKWDPEVGAEYFFNLATGEASWLDPRYRT